MDFLKRKISKHKKKKHDKDSLEDYSSMKKHSIQINQSHTISSQDHSIIKGDKQRPSSAKHPNGLIMTETTQTLDMKKEEIIFEFETKENPESVEEIDSLENRQNNLEPIYQQAMLRTLRPKIKKDKLKRPKTSKPKSLNLKWKPAKDSAPPPASKTAWKKIRRKGRSWRRDLDKRQTSIGEEIAHSPDVEIWKHAKRSSLSPVNKIYKASLVTKNQSKKKLKTTRRTKRNMDLKEDQNFELRRNTTAPGEE